MDQYLAELAATDVDQAQQYAVTLAAPSALGVFASAMFPAIDQAPGVQPGLISTPATTRVVGPMTSHHRK